MPSPKEAPDGVAHDPETRHRRRQIYYGWGTSASVEKDVYGRFLHDAFSALGEVSVLGFPALWWITFVSSNEFFGVKNAALFALPTMVLTVAVYRGRLLGPPWSDTEGWVALTPALVLFRVLYYTVTLLAVGYVGGFLGTTVGLGGWSIPVVIGLAGVATAVFPAAADRSRDLLAE